MILKVVDEYFYKYIFLIVVEGGLLFQRILSFGKLENS
jgi:hypothetical protein